MHTAHEAKPEPDSFIAIVTHLSAQGLGVVRSPAGRVYFARGVWPGDKASFRASEEGEERYQFADLLELHEASPERRPPAEVCPHLGLGPQQCYGCPWMIATMEAQLRQKEYKLRFTFQRFGLHDLPIKPIWPSSKQWGYRRRAQFKTNGSVLGYAASRGLSIAPVETCAVLTPILQAKLLALRERLPVAEWVPSPPYLWNFIDLDEDSALEPLTLNRRRPFQQAHAEQNQRMQAWVKDQLLRRGRQAPLLELFAGSGNFTGIAVELGLETIFAFEVAAQAVEALRRLGPAVMASRLDLYKSHALHSLGTLCARAQTLLINPPRAGLQRLSHLAGILPRLNTILYISCEASSLARDLKQLIARGFQVVEVQALDQMPQTPHLEVLVQLQRNPNFYAFNRSVYSAPY